MWLTRKTFKTTYLLLPVHLDHVLKLRNCSKRNITRLFTQIRKAGKHLECKLKSEVEIFRMCIYLAFINERWSLNFPVFYVHILSLKFHFQNKQKFQNLHWSSRAGRKVDTKKRQNERFAMFVRFIIRGR